MKRFITMLLAVAICFSLAACGGVAPEHKEILSLLENERYDEAIYKIEELRDAPETDGNGETLKIALEGYQKESLYSTVTNFLNNFNYAGSTQERNFYDQRTEDNVTCKTNKEAFDFIKGIIADLGDYENASDQLERMYEVNDVLLKTETTYKDAFGTEQYDGRVYFNYDRDGKLIERSSSNSLFTYYTRMNSQGEPRYEYNEDGTLAKITFSSGENISAEITYTYENGNIKTERGKKSDGYTFEVTYIYDENGRLAEMKNVPNSTNLGWEDTFDVKFTYDEVGNLIKEAVETVDEQFRIYTYKYENGKLVYKEEAEGDRREYGADHKVHVPEYTGWEYTYDSEGRIDTVTKLDLGHLDENRNQVDYQGNPVDGSDLDFPRVTKYTYGTFFGVTEE